METILSIDDDQIYLDALKLNLESYGYRVLTGGSVREGWGKLERERVDLVILDAVLPDEDGCEFARRLRAHDRHAPIPVIFLSGYAGAGEQARAFEAGADDFLVKPCSPPDLISRVRSHLKRRAWQVRIDEGLSRIQEVERTRDELLAVLLHEVGGLVSTIEAELRAAAGNGDIARAIEYAKDLSKLVEGVRARYAWRKLGVAPASHAEPGVN